MYIGTNVPWVRSTKGGNYVWGNVGFTLPRWGVPVTVTVRDTAGAVKGSAVTSKYSDGYFGTYLYRNSLPIAMETGDTVEAAVAGRPLITMTVPQFTIGVYTATDTISGSVWPLPRFELEGSFVKVYTDGTSWYWIYALPDPATGAYAITTSVDITRGDYAYLNYTDIEGNGTTAYGYTTSPTITMTSYPDVFTTTGSNAISWAITKGVRVESTYLLWDTVSHPNDANYRNSYGAYSPYYGKMGIYTVTLSVPPGITIYFKAVAYVDGRRIETPEYSRPSGPCPDIGICLFVLNQAGQPARWAQVRAYRAGCLWPDWWGSTDSFGYEWLNVPSGVYTLEIASSNDHFYLIKPNIPAPSFLYIGTAGAVDVDFTASDESGNPLDACIYLRAFNPVVGVGCTGYDGQMTATLTPYSYTMFAWDWGDPIDYYLSKAAALITGPTTVAFDAAVDTGRLNIRLFDFDHGFLWPWSSRLPGGAPGFWFDDGDGVIFSADIYQAYGHFRRYGVRLGATGYDWYYYFDLAISPLTVTAGGVYTMTAGGVFTASTATDKAVYTRGEEVYLTNAVSDAFGNRMTWAEVYTYEVSASTAEKRNEGASEGSPGAVGTRKPGDKPSQVQAAQEAPAPMDWSEIYPRVIVRNPAGGIIYSAGTWEPSVYFYLPWDAPEGRYTVTLSVETHQGMVTATSGFPVGTPPGGVVGRVDLQGRSNDSGAIITLTGSVYTTTTVADGAFTITDVAAGTYTATASMRGYLYAQRGGVVVTAGETMVLPLVRLLGGNAVVVPITTANRVDIYDLTLLGANFGLSVPPADARADITGNNAVNIFDLVLVGANYYNDELDAPIAPIPW